MLPRECQDYLLGSECTVYTDNNLLADIQTRKLGVLPVCWISELGLFGFNIQYGLGKTSKAADALSQCQVNPEFEMESNSDNDSEDPVMLSYATICNTIKPVLKDTKSPYNILKEAQAISNALEGEDGMNVPELPEVHNLTAQTSAVSVFSQVTLATMAKAQTKDSVLGLVIQYVLKGNKPKGSAI